MLRDQVVWEMVGSCLRVQALATGCSSSQYHRRHPDWNLVTAGFSRSARGVTHTGKGVITYVQIIPKQIFIGGPGLVIIHMHRHVV